MTNVAEGEGEVLLPLPPQPRRPLSTWQLLRIGFANTLAACDEELFEALIVERRYVWGRVFVVSDPDGIKQVLQDNLDNYPRIDPIRRVFAFGSGTGMLCAEGEAWRRHRRILNPTLDRRSVVADVPKLVRLTETFADYLESLPAGSEIDISRTFGHLLTRSNGEIFAGEDRSIDPILDRMGHHPGEYRLIDFLPSLRRLGLAERFGKGSAEARTLGPLIDRMINQRRAADYGGGKDLLWRLAHARDRTSGEGLSPAELQDEALTLGSTAATSLQVYGWLWYLLALHPWAEEKLLAEIEDVLGSRSPSVEDLGRLVYARKIIDETMRLYPPLPIMPRRAIADDVICGRRIPRRSYVLVMPWVVHRHRKLWADPDRFDPERFAPEETTRRSRYMYLPFSVGPHVCIGATLALTEILIAVAVLARRFRFRLVPGQRIEPIAWTNLRPRPGIRVKLEPRPSARDSAKGLRAAL